MESSITIRTMEAGDLSAALALTQAEKWPHRAEDWQLHFDAGYGWVAESDGKVIGTTLVWPFGDNGEVATLGLIVVDRNFQGKGIGRLLVKRAIEFCSEKELRLVATEAGLKLYQQNGFERSGSVRQCQGEPLNRQNLELPAGTECRDLSRSDLGTLITLDAKAFGATRETLFKYLIDSVHGKAIIQNGEIRSFALIRKGGRGIQFGPVVAANDNDAKCLINALLPVDGEFTRLDITDAAEGLLPWIESMGLKQVDRVTAMTRNAGATKQRDVKTYGLVSQAFG